MELTDKEKELTTEAVLCFVLSNMDAATDCLNKDKDKDYWRNEDVTHYLFECSEYLTILQKLGIEDVKEKMDKMMGFLPY